MSSIETLEPLRIQIAHKLPQGLSHPGDRFGFFTAAREELSDIERENIRARYPEEQVGGIIEFLGMGAMRDAARRQSLELENAALLIGNGPHQASYTAAYNELAGNKDTLPEYLGFFSRLTKDFFAREPVSTERTDIIEEHCQEIGAQLPQSRLRPVTKVALELLGCFQRGDWEGTAIVDDPMRKLREELLADRRYGYKELETPGQKKITYRFEKLPDNKAGEGHAFGLITRRRNVANVLGNIGIFKQSHGLVVIDYLDEKIKQLVDKVGFGVIDKNGAATMVGKQFEADITSEKGASRAIVPTSAHYLMLAKRSTA
ncbi:MAG TPA: hypothetical protein PLT04_03240 [Candidatus Saccharibacteria bacterium]|jgi:hypothetical protein|nr:hypothetical protein [Candidatus Saccharibacteria bacterium]